MFLNAGGLSDQAKKVFREGIGHPMNLEMKKRGTKPATSTQKERDQQVNQMIDLRKSAQCLRSSVEVV